jgi:hypothetical protein
MPAGLVDIISYGSQDLFLTGAAQITFFKVVYRRYTNFAVESFEIPFDDTTGFGLTSNAILQPIGDLVHRAYLKVKIPKINFTRSVAPPTIKESSQNLSRAYCEYQRCLIFMNANSNAYRAAMDISSASNVLYSEEVVDVILRVFGSYLISTVVNDISWFQANSPLDHIPPSNFNLFTIARNFKRFLGTGDVARDPLIITKNKFKSILDQAISYCQRIQQYYDDQLREAIALNEDATNPNLKFAWVDRLGHSIIDYIDVYIGGERIDRQYGIWINIWYELCGKKDQEGTYMKMIGNVPELITFDRAVKPEYTLYIPLQFWFNRFNGLCIPLVALQYYDVSISIRLRKFSECAYVEDNLTGEVNLNNLVIDPDPTGYSRSLEATLLVDYIYLDSLERKKFAQSSHEYLIDQIQVLKVEDIDNLQSQIRLDFNHPCKEMIWVLQKQAFVENTTGFIKSRWNNYTPSKFNRGLSIDYASLDFNGYSRFDRFNGMYFNYLQPYDHHSNTPADGINVYSFSLCPEEHQPTGSCNFTRIAKAILNLWINPRMFHYSEYDRTDEDNPNLSKKAQFTKINLWIFAITHNILRLISGMGGLAYI